MEASKPRRRVTFELLVAKRFARGWQEAVAALPATAADAPPPWPPAPVCSLAAGAHSMIESIVRVESTLDPGAMGKGAMVVNIYKVYKTYKSTNYI